MDSQSREFCHPVFFQHFQCCFAQNHYGTLESAANVEFPIEDIFFSIHFTAITSDLLCLDRL